MTTVEYKVYLVRPSPGRPSVITRHKTYRYRWVAYLVAWFDDGLYDILSWQTAKVLP